LKVNEPDAPTARGCGSSDSMAGALMAGKNPYIEQAHVEAPKKKYTMTILPEGKVIEVDPAKMPYGRTGEPGSILDIALAHGIALDHACGGVCACSTCHVIVRQGLESCNEATDDEIDMIEEARGVELESRLSCQCVPNGTMDVVVEIPSWNRNLVKEHE
jgi:2Fe-2S ferredoxin